jgi:WD40 repeat protein
VAVGALPDGTPVIVSGGFDGTVRVWRLADGTPAGNPITGHTSKVEAVAVGALPDRTPVIVSGGHGRGAGVAAGRRHPGREPDHRLHQQGGSGGGGGAAGPHPVIVSGGDDRTARVRRLTDGTVRVRRLARRPLSMGFRVAGRPPPIGRNSPVLAVAAGALPDGTPVIVSGGFDGTVRVWRLTDAGSV